MPQAWQDHRIFHSGDHRTTGFPSLVESSRKGLYSACFAFYGQYFNMRHKALFSSQEGLWSGQRPYGRDEEMRSPCRTIWSSVPWARYAIWHINNTLHIDKKTSSKYNKWPW